MPADSESTDARPTSADGVASGTLVRGDEDAMVPRDQISRMTASDDGFTAVPRSDAAGSPLPFAVTADFRKEDVAEDEMHRTERLKTSRRPCLDTAWPASPGEGSATWRGSPMLSARALSIGSGMPCSAVWRGVVSEDGQQPDNVVTLRQQDAP